MIYFSSGSTKTPKPICLNHYYFLALIIPKLGLKPPTNTMNYTFSHHKITSVSVRYANWYWISAAMEMLIFIEAGGCRLMQDEMCINKIWFMIEKYRITETFLTPLQCIKLSQCQKPNNVDISSLRKITTGGYVLHKDYVCNLRKLLPGVDIFQTYGMTECGIASHFNMNIPYHKKLMAEKPDSCGMPVAAGLHYKVIDVNTGKKCGPNQPGELYLKGKQMFNGFYNQDSSESFDKDGFFRTEDLVYFDNDFCFYVVDRIKAVLGWNDWLIYPSYIEKILCSHPSVENAMVIGIPHKIEGERLMGVVILKKDAEKVTEEELIKHVENRVEDHQRLREGVVFVKEFPMTITGKASRLKVKEMVMNSLNK